MKRSTLLVAVSTLAFTSLASAHPGHGLGTLGHAFDHALWNFAGCVVLAVAALLACRLPASASRKREDHDRQE